MAHAVPSTSAMPGRLALPALCLGSFVTVLNAAAPAPFFPAMSRELDVSTALLGQVSAAMMILSAPLALIAGPLADRHGPRRFILAGLAAAVLSLLVFGLAPVFPVLFGASIAGAVAGATVPGLSMSIAGTRFPQPATRKAIGWIVAALASAPIVGIPILTTIGDLAGWRAAFLAAATAAAVVVMLVALWLPADPARAATAARPGKLLAAYRLLLADPGMRRLYASTLTRSVCWLGMLTYFGAMLEEAYGLATGEIGLVYMLGGAGYFAGSLAAGGPLARFPTRALVAIGTATMALLVGAIFPGVLPAALIVTLLPVAAFMGAVGWVGLASLLTSETPAGAGTTMVLNSALFNLGAAAGAGLGGVLLASGGFGAVAVGLPLFGLMAALLIGAPRRGPAAA